MMISSLYFQNPFSLVMVGIEASGEDALREDPLKSLIAPESDIGLPVRSIPSVSQKD
jgi:hypothetical protein